MMIQLKLIDPVKTLDGVDMVEKGKPLTMAKVVAVALSETSHKGNPLKLYDLAFRFNRDETVTVDDSDFQLVREVMMDSATIPLVKAPIIRALDSAKSGTMEGSQ